MTNTEQLVNMLLDKYPEVRNNPLKMKILNEIVIPMDAEKGQEMAKKLCETNGTSQGDAVRSAEAWIGNLAQFLGRQK